MEKPGDFERCSVFETKMLLGSSDDGMGTWLAVFDHEGDVVASVGANAVVPFPPPQPFKASERRRMAAAVCPFFMNSSLSLKIRNAPVPSSLRTDIPVSPTVRISRTDVRYF